MNDTQNFLIELSDSAAREALTDPGKRRGLRLDQVVPGRGYLERLTVAELDELTNDGVVRSSTPLGTSLKIDASVTDDQDQGGQPSRRVPLSG